MSERLQHPEATANEVWIGNIYPGDFGHIGWQTKRLGKRPLDSFGAPLKGGGFRPVFVARTELLAANVDIPAIGPVDHRW